MNIRNYEEFVLSTEVYEFENLKERLTNVNIIRLLHSAIGCSTESNELLDNLKKHIFYGKELDLVNIEEELGDILWYIQIALNVIDKSFEEIMEKNIDKLKARYSKGFTEADANNRDLEKERKILEK